jgi:hypothetical protein
MNNQFTSPLRYFDCPLTIIVAISLLSATLHSDEQSSETRPLPDGLNNVALVVTPKQPHFKSGDKVVLQISVVNNSSEVRTLDEASDCNVIFGIFNDSDIERKVYSSRSKPPPETEHYPAKPIAPGSSTVGQVILNEEFNVERPGVYIVTVYHLVFYDPKNIHKYVDSRKERNYLTATTQFTVDKP